MTSIPGVVLRNDYSQSYSVQSRDLRADGATETGKLKNSLCRGYQN
jgi:hypothetical protein